MLKHEDVVVEKRVGKKFLQMRESHKLPFYYSENPLYDRALPRVCKEIVGIDKYLSLIDVGANIGDTISLVTDEVSGSFLCIDADSEYLPFLKINTDRITGSSITIEESYCSDNDNKTERFEIERVNGTAKMVSAKNIAAISEIKFKTLDEIVKKHSKFINSNVLKIDTDGFELNVLRGGEAFIDLAKPVIYFEFYPELCMNNGHDPILIFDFLSKNGYEEVMVYDNFGVPFEVINTSDLDKIKNLMDIIDNKNIHYYDILTYHKSRERDYKSIFEKEFVSSVRVVLRELEDLKILSKKELESVKADLHLAEEKSNSIYSSYEWKLVLILRKLANLIIPKGSIQRKSILGLWKFLKSFLKNLKKIKSALYFYKMRILKVGRKKKRKINDNSKKIVYVGHSYHDKTKSTVFLIDYLKEFYDVEVILDESWEGKGKEYPDLSFIDDSYLGVVFFQNLPGKNILKNIKNDNIIFFPMYDGVGQDYSFWESLSQYKIINFSKTLHRRLKKWGFETIEVQYFPVPQEFVPGKKDEIFFWQRLTKMNIDVISKLLGGRKFKMHIHKAIDPYQQFQQPTIKQEEDFQITYSEWFETRAEMWDVIKQKGIYVAPRELEGIGQSFLEAMSMGKAVMAVDNPTMNEYIEHGKNGYLFDLNNPKEIDFSDIENVQKNTYKFMQDGFEKWEKDKKKIIEFIEKA